MIPIPISKIQKWFYNLQGTHRRDYKYEGQFDSFRFPN